MTHHIRDRFRRPTGGRHSHHLVLIDWPFFGYGEWKRGPARANRRSRRAAKRDIEERLGTEVLWDCRGKMCESWESDLSDYEDGCLWCGSIFHETDDCLDEALGFYRNTEVLLGTLAPRSLGTISDLCRGQLASEP
jgi:hypothetical protein